MPSSMHQGGPPAFTVDQLRAAVLAGEVDTVIVAFTDMQGRLQGKRLHGRYFIEPATVRILVAVEPDAENRALLIEADGDQMYRSSELTLTGASDKRLHSIEFRNLPAGAYTLRAQVRSAHDVRGSATQDLFVTGSGAQ